MAKNIREAVPENENGHKSEGQNQGNGAREGSYRNVETSVGSRKDFDDDFAVEEENRISKEEARTEKEDNTGKG